MGMYLSWRDVAFHIFQHTSCNWFKNGACEACKPGEIRWNDCMQPWAISPPFACLFLADRSGRGFQASKVWQKKDVTWMESDRQMAHLTPSPLWGISQNCDQRFTLECICQVLFHKEFCVVSLYLHGFLTHPVCRFRLSIKKLESVPRCRMVAGSRLSDVQCFCARRQ